MIRDIDFINKIQISQDIQADLDNGVNIDEIIPSIEALQNHLEATTYNPEISITTTTISVKPISTTFQLNVSGIFLDSLTDVEISALDDTGISVSIESASLNQITLNITTNGVAQDYTLSFLKGTNLIDTLVFPTASLTLIIPSLNGTGQSLWQQPDPVPAANVVTLSDGRFEAEQATGRGWDNHAYYGGFTGSFTTVVHEFTTRNSTNAYCYIRFNNAINPSTGGSPRVYISNGNNFRVYSNTGTQLYSGTLNINDKITVEFTSTTMEVFINGASIIQNTADYTAAMQGSFVNFTSYRNTILENIETKLI